MYNTNRQIITECITTIEFMRRILKEQYFRRIKEYLSELEKRILEKE